jgi:hypothetical protein
MLKQIFNHLQAPFRLMGFDVDQLERSLIVGGMSGEVTKIPD